MKLPYIGHKFFNISEDTHAYAACVDKRAGERGNVFFALFGAVAVVGVLGAGIMSTMRGPLSTMVEVNRMEQAKSELRVAASLVLTASDDDSLEVGCAGEATGDGYTEGPAPAGAGPTGGGVLPMVGSAQNDPWGNAYGYCAWNHGPNAVPEDTAACGGVRVGSTGTNNIAIAVMSAGPDGVWATTCEDHGEADPYVAPDGGGDDDIVVSMTYSQAITGSGGLWTDVSPTVASINRDLDITGDTTFTGGGTFTDVLNLTGASAQLQLGEKSLILPDETVLTDLECDLANDSLVRINKAGGYKIEVCNNGTGWVSSSVWSLNGAKTFYNAGNVGIGVSDPDDALDVVGSAQITGAVSLDNSLSVGTTTVLNGDTIINGDAAGAGVTNALAINDSVSASLFIVGNDGTVGIGVSNPVAKLDVAGRVNTSSSYAIEGENVVRAPSTSTSSIYLGRDAGEFDITPVTGVRNTVVGASTGATLTTGTDNILIGQGVDTPLAGTSNYLNIGGTIIGDLANGDVSIARDLSVTNDLSVGGDLTLSGDDFVMGTNTAGYVLVADGSDFSPVAMSGDVAIDGTGATVIQNNAVQYDDLQVAGSGTGGNCMKTDGSIIYVDACGSGSGGGGAQNLSDVLSTGNDGDANLIKNIGDPVDDQDAATKKYVDNNGDNLGDHTATEDLQMGANKILLGAGNAQYLSGNDGSTLSYYSNVSTTTNMSFNDKEGTLYGRVHGGADGAWFGLQDGDGQFSYLAKKDTSTELRINNLKELELFPTYLSLESNLIKNLLDPVDPQDGATKAYVDSVVLSGGNALADFDNDTKIEVDTAGNGSADTTVFTNDGAERMRIMADGRIGIGTATPSVSSFVHIDKDFTANASRYGLYTSIDSAPSALLTSSMNTFGIYNVVNTVYQNDATNGHYGQTFGNVSYVNYDHLNTGADGRSVFSYYGRTRQAGSGTLSSAVGGEFSANTGSNGGTISKAFGVQGITDATNGGTIDSARGIQGYARAYGTGSNITNAVAIRGEVSELDIGGVGTITTGQALYGDCNDAATCYGLFVAAGDAEVTAGQDWGVYVTGEDKNYLSGKLGVGTATISDASAGSGVALDVDIEGNLGAANYCDEEGNNCFTAATGGADNLGDHTATEDLNMGGDNIRFGADNLQKLTGNNSAALQYYSNNSTDSGIIFYDKEGAVYGRVYGNANGENFGLLDGDGSWSYLAVKDTRTDFRINNADEMRLFPTYLSLESNLIKNLLDPVDDQDGATKKYVDDEIAAGGSKWLDGVDTNEIYYSAGNVGIGTDDPQYALHVTPKTDEAAIFIDHDGTQGNRSTVQFNNGYSQGFEIGMSNTIGSPRDFIIAEISGASGTDTTNPRYTFNGDGDGLFSITDAADSDVKVSLNTNGNSFLTGGSVSIGDTSASDGSADPNGEVLLLDVAGAIGGTHYCDEDGLNCSTATDLAAAVSGGVSAIDDLSDAATSATDFNLFLGHDGGSFGGNNLRNTSTGFGSLDALNNDGVMPIYGNDNSAFGYNALTNNTTGAGNSALGTNALANNISGDFNVAIGLSTLLLNTSGNRNMAIGRSVLVNNTSGSDNAAIGNAAMNINDTGSNNVAIGASSLRYNTSGDNNVAIGKNAGNGESDSSVNNENVFLGAFSGSNVTTADNNILLGYQAGNLITTGDSNIIIGYNINPTSATASSELNIGSVIFGDLTSGQVGINNNDPQYELDVTGQIRVGTSIFARFFAPAATSAVDFLSDNSQSHPIRVGGVQIGGSYTTTPIDGELVTANNISIVLKPNNITAMTVPVSGNIVFNGTGAARLNTGTTVQRPSGVDGMLRFNTTTDAYEVYSATTSAWVEIVSAGLAAGGGGASALDDLSDALADYSGENIILGRVSATALTVGAEYNTFIGKNSGSTSLNSTVSTDSNTALGDSTLSSLAEGSDNTAVGRFALNKNTNGSNNTAVGRNVLIDNITGENNVGLGYNALEKNVGRNLNTGIGAFALRFSNDEMASHNTYNTALGAFALQGSSTAANNTGKLNTALGARSLLLAENADKNSVLGYEAGRNIVSGDNNLLLGFKAGDLITTGNSNIIVGHNINPDSAFASNQLNIGNVLYGDLSNDRIGIGKIPAAGVELDVLGDIEYTGTITDVSDRRLKENIVPLIEWGSLLERIGGINTYSFVMKDSKKGRIEYGVMAQELEEIFPDLVHTAIDEMGTKSVNYVGLIAPMIEATKELKVENDGLRAELSAIKANSENVQETLASLSAQVEILNRGALGDVNKASMIPVSPAAMLMFLMMLMSLGGGFYIVTLRKKIR